MLKLDKNILNAQIAFATGSTLIGSNNLTFSDNKLIVQSDSNDGLKNVLELKNDLYQILADATSKDFATIEKDCDRDYWLRANEAKEYGLVDQVLSKRP
jgi:hypothetical protein